MYAIGTTRRERLERFMKVRTMCQAAMGTNSTHNGLESGASTTITSRTAIAELRSTGNNTANRHGTAITQCVFAMTPLISNGSTGHSSNAPASTPCRTGERRSGALAK